MNSRVYHILNASFASIVLSIIIYSIIFKGNNHPIPALLTQVTGLIPPSKGLSASFSEVVRGNFHEALLINPYSLIIFAFFAIQFLARILASIVVQMNWLRVKWVVVIDVAFSSTLFVFCFAPLIKYTFNLFAQLF